MKASNTHFGGRPADSRSKHALVAKNLLHIRDSNIMGKTYFIVVVPFVLIASSR